MNSKKKIFLIIVIVVLLVVVVGFSLNQTQKNVVAVQTAKVARQDIASTVTASGEIKPKTFVNVGANAFGRITKLFVQEGDRVKKGQMLAQLENVQPAADVAAMRATLQSNETDSVAAEANLNTEMAQLNSSKADAARIKLEYDRAESLYKNQLIAKSDYDAKKAAYEVSTALIAQNQARIAQARAQLDSARGHIGQARAQVTRASDALGKT
jgi:HlyD family secretion protein